MGQKLLVGGFKWIEDTSQFSKDVIKNYNEDSDGEYHVKFNATKKSWISIE